MPSNADPAAPPAAGCLAAEGGRPRHDELPQLAVELVVQTRDEAGYQLQRSQHRRPAGTTIRQLLQGHPEGSTLVTGIEGRTLGLSRFGRRAWLDDPLLADDRIEILQPLLADARAARFARVAQARAARNGQGGWRKQGATRQEPRRQGGQRSTS